MPTNVPDCPQSERRARRRFQLVFPVVFHWHDVTRHSVMGYSRNVGLGGIFIVTTIAPPVETEIEIDVVVPAFELGPNEILIKQQGRVVRAEECGDLIGFAVAGEFSDSVGLRE
jgi:PilZ domain-containing protein